MPVFLNNASCGKAGEFLFYPGNSAGIYLSIRSVPVCKIIFFKKCREYRDQISCYLIVIDYEKSHYTIYQELSG